MNGIKAENLVWIFGTGRSGSTWLASMMGEPVLWREDEEYKTRFWNEPLVGQLFGRFHEEVPRRQLGREAFILSDSMREAWLAGIRCLILGGAAARFPGLPEGGYLVVKEPNGSIGAPLLMEALPESRMVLLVRDPRDVAASALDRHAAGGIAHENRSKDPRGRRLSEAGRADKDPDAFVRGQARRYTANLSRAWLAHDNHRGPKALVRYEDLRADAPGELARIFSALNIPVAAQEVARVAEMHAWKNVPEDRKGRGKDRRKASPGGWREDLTPEQARIVEDVTAPLLERFYGKPET